MMDAFGALSPRRDVPSLHDSIVGFLREHGGGTSARALAERFLKFKNPDPKLAGAAIAAILSSDRRCTVDDDGLWHAARPVANAAESLRQLPWSAMFCLTDPEARRILYCARWEPFTSPSCSASGWIIDPAVFPFEERELLAGGGEEFVTEARYRPFFNALLCTAGKRITVFLSSNTRALFAAACARGGESSPDDTLLIGELVKAAGLTAARPLTLANFETAVFGAEQRGASARRQGERLAALLAELVVLLFKQGIETRADLDQCGRDEKAALFSGKEFSYNDILALPPLPGIYGFKDKEGSYLYIGKAKNLKRRLASYFADTDESPGKLRELHEKSHSLITHGCGSELECLIHEYRLIKKFVPPLNKKIAINERPGIFERLHDCIVLLPHADPGKGMAVWFRENQKMLLKAFDTAFPADSPLIAELETFFFSPKLSCGVSDFPEQEIATRWIKQHADFLTVVPVSRMAAAGEVYDAMRIAWREFSENGFAA